LGYFFSVDLFSKKRAWPTLSYSDIVQRSRILVIDDQEFLYKPLFERDGYTIQQWPDVSDLQAIEHGAYDLILLDLKGVGRAESADEGFGILKHLRETSPAQIIVAYSNSDLSLEYQPFFRNADAVLHKTKTDYVEFKRTVDRLLMERFSLGFYEKRIFEELGEQAAQVPRAQKKARAAVLSGDVEPLRRYLGRRLDDQVTIDRVIAITAAAAQIASIFWKP
jgi:CheY-like chemotaxis protein